MLNHCVSANANAAETNALHESQTYWREELHWHFSARALKSLMTHTSGGLHLVLSSTKPLKVCGAWISGKEIKTPFLSALTAAPITGFIAPIHCDITLGRPFAHLAAQTAQLQIFKGLYFTQQATGRSVLITNVSSCGHDWSLDHRKTLQQSADSVTSPDSYFYWISSWPVLLIFLYLCHT